MSFLANPPPNPQLSLLLPEARPEGVAAPQTPPLQAPHTDQERRQQAWKAHLLTWRNCLRCKFADERLASRPQDRNAKHPTPVPMMRAWALSKDYKANEEPPPPLPVLLVLPYPDATQSRWACPFGNMKEPYQFWSPTLHALMATFEALEEDLPLTLDDTNLAFALGCRPANFARPRDVVGPSGTVLKACRPRLHAEILFGDPSLVVAFGHWSFASLFPQTPKQADYLKAIGTVRPLRIDRGPGLEPARYCVYVAASLPDVAIQARADQWAAPFLGMPPQSMTRDPVQALRWHLWESLWLAKVVSDAARLGELTLPPPTHMDSWRRLVQGLNTFYEGRYSVEGALERTRALIAYYRDTEQALPGGIRSVQQGELRTRRRKSKSRSDAPSPDWRDEFSDVDSEDQPYEGLVKLRQHLEALGDAGSTTAQDAEASEELVSESEDETDLQDPEEEA